MKRKKVYLDYETFLMQPWCLAPPPVCFVYAIDGGAPQVIHVRDSRFEKLLYEWWHSDEYEIVAHNAAFEVVVTMAYRPQWSTAILRKVDQCMVYCTETRERLIAIARGDYMDNRRFNLAACCEEWKLGIVLDKKNWWRPRFGMLVNIPVELWPEEALAYVLGDVAVRDVFLAQEGHPNAYKWLQDQFNQVQADVALFLTTCNGFPTDGELARELYADTEAKLDLYRDELLAAGVLAPKTKKDPTLKRDTKRAKEIQIQAYAAQGRDPPRGDITPTMLEKAYAASGIPDLCPKWRPEEKKRIKKIQKNQLEKAVNQGVNRELLIGNIKLDEEACENANHPLMLAYARYSTADSLRGKMKRLQFPLIQTSYDVLKATGRTSSWGGDDPDPGEAWTQWGTNIQNLPRAGDVVDE